MSYYKFRRCVHKGLGRFLTCCVLISAFSFHSGLHAQFEDFGEVEEVDYSKTDFIKDVESFEEKITVLVDLLQDSAKGERAAEQLMDLQMATLEDLRPKAAMAKVLARSVHLYKNQLVTFNEVRKELRQDDDIEVEITIGTLAGLVTGEPIKNEDGSELEVDLKSLKRYRANSLATRKLKRGIEVLGLHVLDPEIREKSAYDVGLTGNIELLEQLKKLAETDEVPGVREAAADSYALILLEAGKPDLQAHLDAVILLGEKKSTRALDFLRKRYEKYQDDEAAIAALKLDDADLAKLRDSYAHAIGQIEVHQSVAKWMSNFFFGISLGSVLLLLAVGLAISFGLMGVINMAHGEMLMIGAIATWACQNYLGQYLPPNMFYVLAFPVSFLVAAFAGFLTEITIVRFLYKRPLDSMLATIGVSYILIQLVRMQWGDNFGIKRPDWSQGAVEIMRDVNLANARVFLIFLAAICVIAVFLLFKYTRIGLLLRATVQNREMAQALGVNTRHVDMFTFSLASGLAGLAGYGFYLIGNITPDMGQSYIVDAFLTVVVGGVGKLIGVVISALGLGFLQKGIEPLPLMDATWAKVAILVLVVVFIQLKPSGLFPERGRLADQQDSSQGSLIARLNSRVEQVIAILFIVVFLIVFPILYLSGTMEMGTMNRFGQFMCFAMCAIGLDLLWGYVGVLSLCQFLFFTLGAYCFGFYIINIGDHTAEGIPECLAYVMSDVSNPTAPWYLVLFKNPIVSFILAIIIPGLVALLIGLTTFTSRVKGVYFAILTQAITVVALRVFEKNQLKMGGTNGIRIKFNEELFFGRPIAFVEDAPLFLQTRFLLYILSVCALILCFLIAKWIVRSGMGRVMVAIRDDETRLRFGGYKTWIYKTVIFVVAGMMAGMGGALYFPQKGIVTPAEMSPAASIFVVVLVAFGGRGTLWGPVVGTIAVYMLRDELSSKFYDSWLFALGALFILVPLLLPGGLMSVVQFIQNLIARKRGRVAATITLILSSLIYFLILFFFAPSIQKIWVATIVATVLASIYGVLNKIPTGIEAAFKTFVFSWGAFFFFLLYFIYYDATLLAISIVAVVLAIWSALAVMYQIQKKAEGGAA